MPPEPNPATEKVRRLTDEALSRLQSELKAGRSEALTEFLRAMARFHRYSWTNAMLIQTQRPNATRVAGYHTWRDLGRTVRRGEKGIMIYAPIVAKNSASERLERPKGERDATTERLTGFRAAYVFDLAQTEGRPLPAMATTRGDPGTLAERLKGVVAERGISLSYDASIAPADGVSSGGQIRIRPGLPAAEEFSVLTHELAHEMLHHGPDRTQLPNVVRETQAEAVAFVVSRGIGLETGNAAADYIGLYNGDAKTLTESLGAIQEVSSQILKDLLPEERLPTTQGRSPGLGVGRENGWASQDVEGSDSTRERPLTGPDLSDSMAQDRRTMTLTRAVFGNAKTDWETPSELFGVLNRAFSFTLDVCASRTNHKCVRYFTQAQDGLKRRWTGTCWMNPPYGRAISAWVAKARRESQRGATIVALLPARTDTAWWQGAVMKAREIRLLRGRLTFVGAASPAPFPSAVVIFNKTHLRRAPRVVAWDWRRGARPHPTRTSCHRAAVSPAVAA